MDKGMLLHFTVLEVLLLIFYTAVRVIKLFFSCVAEKYRALRYTGYCNKAIDGFSEYAKKNGISDLVVVYMKQACLYYDRHKRKHHFLPEKWNCP